jgi:hypothetical protein
MTCLVNNTPVDLHELKGGFIRDTIEVVHTDRTDIAVAQIESASWMIVPWCSTLTRQVCCQRSTHCPSTFRPLSGTIWSRSCLLNDQYIVLRIGLAWTRHSRIQLCLSVTVVEVTVIETVQIIE